MKQCPYCSTELEGTEEVCPVCKRNLKDDDREEKPAVRGVDAPTAYVPKEKAKKNGKKGAAITAIVLAVLLVVILIAVFALHRKQPGPAGTEGTTLASNEYVTDAYGNRIPLAVPDTQSESAAPESSAASSEAPSASAASTTAAQSPAQSGAPAETTAGQQAQPTAAPAQQTTAPSPAPTTTQPQNSGINALAYFVNAINNRSYAMKGTMTTGDETLPIGIMFNGENTRMSTVMDGISVDMAIVDKKMYILNNDKKTYVSVTQALAEKAGIEADDFNVEDLDWQLSTPDKATVEKVSLDGKEVDCYTLPAGSGSAKIYFDGTTVKRFDRFDSNGTCATSMVMESFRGDITDKDLLPSDDYTSQNFISFFMDMAPDM